MSQTSYKLHKWSGLTLAILLFLQGLTGLILSYRDSLQALGHPAAYGASKVTVSFDQIAQNLSTTFRDHKIDRVVYPHNETGILVARAYNRDGLLEIAHLHPTTGETLSVGPVWQYPVQLADRLHVSLTLGQTGHLVLLIEAVCLLMMVVTGLIVWWPGLRKLHKGFRIKWTAPAPRLLRELHIVPGVIIAPFLAISALTGALMIAEPVVKSTVAVFAPVDPDLSIDLSPTDQSTPTITWQAALDLLRQRFPDGMVRQARFFGPEQRLFGVIMVAQDASNPRAHHMAGVDRLTGELIVFADANQAPAGQAFIDWLLPLHSGEAYGILRPIIMTVLGVGLMGLAVTGVVTWFNKRPRAKRKAEPFTV